MPVCMSQPSAKAVLHPFKGIRVFVGVRHFGLQGSSDMLLARFSLQCSCLPCMGANLACLWGLLSSVAGPSAQALITRRPLEGHLARPAQVRFLRLCSVLTFLLVLQVSPTRCPPR